MAGTFDVIVLGAGPAGATAARVCAQLGLSTLLLEKERLPRDKPCGGGISPGALKELDFELPGGFLERSCPGMRAVAGSVRNEVVADHPVAFMTTRKRFDAFLAAKAREAGAVLRDGEACGRVMVEREAVLVEAGGRQYRAQVLIGADGFFSVAAKVVRPAFSARETRFCLIAEAPMEPARVGSLTANLVELRYGYIDHGYAWAFPKKDHISYGIGGSYERARSLRKSFQEFLSLHGVAPGVKMKGCFIPISSFRHDACADRIMLAGDAAGFVDAFSGEGIRFAIASGRMAAHQAAEALRLKDFSASSLRGYQESFYTAFREDLLWSQKLSRLSFRFPDLILATLLMDSRTILRYFQVMAGEDSFKGFARWAIARLPGLLLKRYLLPAGPGSKSAEP